MNLKDKLDEYLLKGLKENNKILYIIDIEKEDDHRYMFTIRFSAPIPIPFPLSRTILFNVNNETYKRRDIKTNIYFLSLIILLIVIMMFDIFICPSKIETDRFLIRLIGISSSIIIMTILPYIILQKYMKRILSAYQNIDDERQD